MIFLRTVLPNLTIALNLALTVIIYLDKRNPMMGFLVGWPFLSLVILSVLASITTAVVLYKDWRCGRYDRKPLPDLEESEEN